jgi:hypothetical protein
MFHSYSFFTIGYITIVKKSGMGLHGVQRRIYEGVQRRIYEGAKEGPKGEKGGGLRGAFIAPF